jgi:hypothetical protein
MTPALNWYAIKLELRVRPPDEGQRAIADLQEELEARLYYKSPLVTWQPDSQTITVKVHREATSESIAGDLMAEELLEVASAVLSNAKSAHVDVVEVQLA